MEITNVTDVPGSKHAPMQVDIYNKTLDPGVTIKIPAELVTANVRKLEAAGYISIGQVPSWYLAAKNRKGSSLTLAQTQERLVTKKVAPKLPELVTPMPTPTSKVFELEKEQVAEAVESGELVKYEGDKKTKKR